MLRISVHLRQCGSGSPRDTKAIKLQQQLGTKHLFAAPLAHPQLYIEVSELVDVWENENLEVLGCFHNPCSWNMLITIVSLSLLLLLQNQSIFIYVLFRNEEWGKKTAVSISKTNSFSAANTMKKDLTEQTSTSFWIHSTDAELM